MIRWVIVTLLGLLVMAFMRGVMGMIKREVNDMMSGQTPAGAQPGANSTSTNSADAKAPVLKKCAACGTYSPEDRLVSGVYCSAACAEKGPRQ
jgi:hypothetical protein